MTRQDLPRAGSGSNAAPIIAFLAIFGLTLVVFFLQFDSSPAELMTELELCMTVG